MNSDELKEIWLRADHSALPAAVTPELIWRLAKESARFDRTIRWRDLREWAATILIAGIFLRTALLAPHIHWALIAAAGIACLPMTYVTWVRPKRLQPDASASVRDHLRESIAEVQHQIDLLNSVASWYLTPLAISAVIAMLDHFFTVPARPAVRMFLALVNVVGGLFVAAVFFAVWKLNQVTARKKLQPRLAELQATLAALDD